MTPRTQEVVVPVGNGLVLTGTRCIPNAAHGVVLFTHGSGSSRRSVRNQVVARFLQGQGLATLLLDLFTEEEEEDGRARQWRFDVELLGARVARVTDWLLTDDRTRRLPIGYFGASTGAAAALVAASRRESTVRAVVSRGGRPDLAREHLTRVRCPTLLIVGGDDVPVISLNQQALISLPGQKRLEIVRGATHLFEEPGTLATVAQLAADWFLHHLEIHPRDWHPAHAYPR